MSDQATEQPTPWRKVYQRFGTESQSQFARLMGWDRSKVSRVLADPEGLINGRDQKTLIDVAAKKGVRLTPTDLVPGA